MRKKRKKGKISEEIEVFEENVLFLQKLMEWIMTDNEITYEIRGAIYDVYKELGPGLLESIYEKALRHELGLRGLKLSEQKDVPVIYKGLNLNCELRYDLLVENRVIIEIKSVEEMKKLFYRQTMTYLRLLHLHTGIIVNFNTEDILKSTKGIYNSRD